MEALSDALFEFAVCSGEEEQGDEEADQTHLQVPELGGRCGPASSLRCLRQRAHELSVDLQSPAVQEQPGKV